MGTPEDVAAEKYFTPAMAEEERVKKEIAKIVLRGFGWVSLKDLAIEILSIKGIRIESDDQGLPSVRNAVNKSYNDYMLGQEDMLKAGFVKCQARPRNDN